MPRTATIVVAAFAVAACDSGKPPPAADAIKYVGTLDLAKQNLVEHIGLPMSGSINVNVDLAHGKDDMRKATGTVRVTCAKACRLGDDKTKLVPKNMSSRTAAFIGDGIDFGHVDFDSFDILITFANGQATLTKWDVVSPDVALILSGGLALERTIADSRIDACLRFSAKEPLLKDRPKTHAAIETTGANRSPQDGLFNIALRDRLSDVKRLAVICDGSQPATPPAPPPAAPTMGGDPTAGSAADPPSDPALDGLIAKTVQPTSDTTFDVDVAGIDKLLANPVAVGKGARVVPAVANGKPDGFKLYAIRPASLYERLGFVNGDTVKAVNGTAIDTAATALEVYTKIRDLKKGDSVSVSLMRRGKPLTLTYTLR